MPDLPLLQMEEELNHPSDPPEEIAQVRVWRCPQPQQLHARAACPLHPPVQAPTQAARAHPQHGGVYSLTFAVQRAITLLDVYLETEGEGGGATAIRGTLCSRRVRGRDRRRPFAYDSTSGQFDQSSSQVVADGVGGA